MERAAEGVDAPDGRKRQSEIASNGEDVRGGTYSLTICLSYIKTPHNYIHVTISTHSKLWDST